MAVPFSFGGESLRSFLALGGPSRSARSATQIPSPSARSTETSRQYASSRSPEPHSPTLAQQVERLETSSPASLASASSKSPLLSVVALTSLPTLPHFAAVAATATTTTTTTSEVPRSPGTLRSDPELGHHSVPLSNSAGSQEAHSFEHLQEFLHRAKQPTFLEDAYARQFLRSAAQLYSADSQLGPHLRRTVESPPDTVAFASALSASLRALARNTAAAQQEQQQNVPVSQLPRDALGRPVRDLSSAPSETHSFPTSDASAASALACLAEVSTATRPPRQNVRNPSLLSVSAEPSSQRFERLTPAAQQHLALLWSWMPLLEQLSPANKAAIWHTCELVPDFQAPPAHKRSLFGVAVDHWVNSGDSRSLSVLFGAVGYLKYHDVLKTHFYFPNTTVPVFRAASDPANDGDVHLSLGAKRKRRTSEHFSPEENLRRVKSTTTTGPVARWTVSDHPLAGCRPHSDTPVGSLPGSNSLCSDGFAVSSFGSSPVHLENECVAAACSPEKRSDKMNVLSILNF